MRHQKAGRHLGRTSAHRRALRRNLAASLFEHGTISTTIEKAKFVRPFAEKLITLAKDGSLHARRRAVSMLSDRDICRVEDSEPVKEGTVIQRLFSEVGPRFAQRNGGYTRIIRLPWRRIGDNGRLVLLQLLGEPVAELAKKGAKKAETQAVTAAAEDETAETAQTEQHQETVEIEAEEQPGEQAADDNPSEDNS